MVLGQCGCRAAGWHRSGTVPRHCRDRPSSRRGKRRDALRLGPHSNPQDLPPSPGCPLLGATYPRMQEDEAWLGKEHLSAKICLDPDPFPLPHRLPHPRFLAVWRGLRDPCCSVPRKRQRRKRSQLPGSDARRREAAEPCPGGNEDRAPLLPAIPRPPRQQQVLPAHMDPIRAEIITPGSLAPPCTGKWWGGMVAVGAWGCPGVWSPLPRWVLPGCGVGGERSSPGWAHPAGPGQRKALFLL